MLTNIHLHGRLGKKFGKSFRLDVLNPAEAVRALCRLKKGFAEYLTTSGKTGFGYRVVVNKRNICDKELLARSGPESEYHFFPVPLGAKKKAVFQIILGVVLIAAALYTGGASLSLFGSGASTSVFAAGGGVGFTANMGLSLVFGGIASLVAVPKTPNISSETETRSYLFNGSNTTSRQGSPVPVGYGRLHVGPQIISLGITVNEGTGNNGAGETPVETLPGGGLGGREVYGGGVPGYFPRLAGSSDWLGGIDRIGSPIQPVFPSDGVLQRLSN